MAFNSNALSSVYNIIFIILGIIGLIWLIYSIWYNSKIDNIKTWPRTDATLVNIVLEPESQKNTYINVENLDTFTDQTVRFTPHVLYTYTVGGRTYQSTNFMFGRQKTYDALATRTLAGHLRPGSTIQVFYNPTNPSESYIYNGAHNHTGTWMGLILLALAAILAYYYNTNNNAHSPAKNYYDYDVKTPTISETSPTVTVTKTARSRKQFF